MLKLDLGAGDVSPPDFLPMGRAHGTEIFPLAYEDGTIDEIRASHVLEHFPYSEVPKVVQHWADKLKPGGVMKIAVPDFAMIAKAYDDGVEAPIEGYVLGGQTDENDFHKSLFDERTLADYLSDAGLTDIARWDSDCEDCSRLPVSLNLRAVKPVPMVPGSFKVLAIMSMPRLGFTDNFMCAHTALTKMGIEVRPFVGAFWGQCLERGLDMAVSEGFDAVLTIDYDTVFTAQNVNTLLRLMLLHPEADAICPLQSARGWHTPLMTMELPEGMSPGKVPTSYFSGDLIKLRTGHFGLTLIRTASLKGLSKPWLWSKPAPDGSWNDGRVDDDIYFWRQWAAAGKTLFNANRVVVGHLELMIKWPGRDLGVFHQRAADFWKDGPPKGVWK
jgi:SAM-dependent methyltransferase